MAHVVIPAGLFQRRAVQPVVARLGVVAVVHSLPGGFGHGIPRAHRVVVEVPAARNEAVEYLGEQSLLAFVGQVVDAHRGHHGIERRGDGRGPLAAGRHVELDVPVAPGVRLHLSLPRPHHLSREVSEDRGAARMQVEDRACRGPGPRPQIQERERLLRAEREQRRHEPPVFRTVSLLGLRLGRPSLNSLPGLPDGRVGVLRLVHEQKVRREAAPFLAGPWSPPRAVQGPWLPGRPGMIMAPMKGR